MTLDLPKFTLNDLILMIGDREVTIARMKTLLETKDQELATVARQLASTQKAIEMQNELARKAQAITLDTAGMETPVEG